MKYAAILISAAFLIPTAIAGENTQSGIQTGNGWSETTEVAVQGGTGFSLTGLAGDFDIFFYDANGGFVGASIACGDDFGTVPASAVTGEVTKWDDVGALPGAACLEPILVEQGLPAQWTYTDGL